MIRNKAQRREPPSGARIKTKQNKSKDGKKKIQNDNNRNNKNQRKSRTANESLRTQQPRGVLEIERYILAARVWNVLF